MTIQHTTQLRPSLTAEALAREFKGDAHHRIRQATATAEHLETLLEMIDAGEIEATPTEIARLEGADLAFRLVGRPAKTIRRGPSW